MKQALLVLSCTAALFSMPLLYANDAPVVDVTQQAQTQAAEPDDGGGDSTQTPLVTSVSPSNAPDEQVPENNNNSAVTQIPPISTSNMSTSKRVSRLEQQVQNLIRMNLPQQVSQLQQKVDKLQGELQVQNHTIDSLNKQLAQNAPGKNADSKKAPYSDVAPSTTTGDVSTKVPPPAVKNVTDEATSYRNAFDLLIKKQYAPAGDAFSSYLKQYPKGQFLVNAHYWLGEIYLLQKKSPEALVQFQSVANDFPNSSKVSDAKLKIAQILAQTGKVPEARQQLTTIIKKYPGSTAAQLAKIQLQQLSPAKKQSEEE